MTDRTFTNAQLVAIYRAARIALAAAKERESKLRLLVATRLFDDPKLGTNHNTCYNLKMVCSEIYTVDKNPEVVAAAFGAMSDAFPGLNLGELVTWKPSLNKAEYEALPEDARRLFNDVLTIKPAMAQVSFTDEKETKE